jgi:uncharacterized protein
MLNINPARRNKNMKRREFLKTSAIATAAMAASPLAVNAKEDEIKIKAYRSLGKTGLKMSDIGIGVGNAPPSSLIHRAIDRGINYIDGGPGYREGEVQLGEIMGKLQRDKLIITSKFSVEGGSGTPLHVGAKKADYIKTIESSLSRMKTDYVDICQVNGIGQESTRYEEEEKRLLDEEMFKAADDLKKAGKIRFMGVTSHGPNNTEALLLKAIECGHFDMIMLALNFMQDSQWQKVLKAAASKGIGVVAMKTLAGAKRTDIDTKGGAYEPAAFKWVLSKPEVSGVAIRVKDVAALDLYLSASGEKITTSDISILNQYAERFSKEYCRTGCNECQAACPKGVPVATIMRYHMYFKEYGHEKQAMESYAGLDNKAHACEVCGDKTCSTACPYELPVSRLLASAHNNLTFMA